METSVVDLELDSLYFLGALKKIFIIHFDVASEWRLSVHHDKSEPSLHSIDISCFPLRAGLGFEDGE